MTNYTFATPSFYCQYLTYRWIPSRTQIKGGKTSPRLLQVSYSRTQPDLTWTICSPTWQQSKVWISVSETSTKESLRIHMEKVHNANFYICDKCGTRTKTLEALSFHTERRHSFDSANNPFKCRYMSLFESVDKISLFTCTWIIFCYFL